jgi:UDP-N-acetylmuramyl pentapeptide phosphotransferase/UDP-N-acetylglucosamine-1-phosphate transferase
MNSFLVSFIISVIFTLFAIRQAKHHEAALDSDLSGVQKVHAHVVPRIGGIGIFLSVVLTGLATMWRAPAIEHALMYLLVCSAVAFIGGIVEDFTGKVSPARRLALTMAAAVLAYWLLDARIDHIDGLLHWMLPLKWMWLSLPLTVLCVAGIANAVNIIDGFNGLASVVSICMLMSLAYVAFQVNDQFVLVSALMVAGATAGFLVWNYPAGLIFMGDGGAYFIGFMLGELSILLVMRNPQISTWYAVLLLIYPVFETLFSIYRRIFLRGRSPGLPDGIHLHSLIFRRIVSWAVGQRDARSLTRRNSMTSPYLWLLSLLAVGPATMLWRHSFYLIVFCLLFIGTYVWLYASIVRFKSPRWMIMRRQRKSHHHKH